LEIHHGCYDSACAGAQCNPAGDKTGDDHAKRHARPRPRHHHGLGAADGDDFISSGTMSFKHTRFDGGGMRFLRFRRWLEQLDIDAGPIEAVYFEEVRRHVGTDAAHIIGRSTAEPDQDYVAKIRRRAAAAILMLRTADSDAPGNVGPSPASWSMRSCAMM